MIPGKRLLAPILVVTAALLSDSALLPGAARGQSPPGSRIVELREEAARTQAARDTARAELDAAVTAYERARTRMAEASNRLRLARERLEEEEAALAQTRDRLARRASSLYKGERVKVLDSIVGARTLDSLIRRFAYAQRIARADTRLLGEIADRRDHAAVVREQVRTEAEAVHAEMRTMSARSDEIMRRMSVLSAALEAVKEELRVEQTKWRFPVLPPYSYVDTFGAPRMVGTQYEHSHQGQDVFAPMGTPVVAVVGGVVENVGEAVLGGTKLWLRGDDGNRYYYAHLSGYAPAGVEGRRVDVGTELGYVGNTGNARGTPPHLHFEMHGAGGVVNPYRTLRDAEAGWQR